MFARSLTSALVLVASGLVAPACAAARPTAQAPGAPPGAMADGNRGLERHDGFIPYRLDTARGEILLEIANLGEPFLYVTHTAAGANWPVRRGDPDWYDGPRIVHLERRGPWLLLVQRNTRYRASGAENPGLDRTVDESLPASVLWAFPIVAEEDGRVLIDATEFLLHDASDLVGNLGSADEGQFRVDRARSALVPELSGGHADATEIEALLTLESAAGMTGELERRSPDHRAVTLRQRHVFLRLSANALRPREFDPRIGMDPMEYWDFDADPERGYRIHRVNLRWRLEKRDPNAAVSEAVEPLIVYLEPGIPRRYRDAVRGGILYWSRALTAAGFRDAIQVRDLPADASPLDYRYPIVVLWHPMDHGLGSVGITVSDPRTGEALKGVVSLTSTRPLQEYREYTPVRAALGAEAPPFEEFLLQKLRWLTAHELGHVLGVNHNNASPTMVSPAAPWLRVTEDGRLVAEPQRIFSAEALPYDRWIMRYLYTPFGTAEEERAGLAAIVEEGLAKGLRSLGTGWNLSPRASQGLHGEHGLDVLERESAVRRALLSAFDEEVLDPGDPPSLLFVRLVQVYFHHNVGIRGATAAVCGLNFAHARIGDGQPAPEPVGPAMQARALNALLAALSPAELAVPEAAVGLIPPRHWAYRPFELEAAWDRPGFVPLPAFVELEASPDDAFDALAWGRALAGFVIDPLLSEGRMRRCESQHARDSVLPSASAVMQRVVDASWGAPMPAAPMDAALQRVARRAVLDRLLALAGSGTATPEVRAAAVGTLARLDADLAARPAARDRVDGGDLLLARRDIARVLGNGAK